MIIRSNGIQPSEPHRGSFTNMQNGKPMRELDAIRVRWIHPDPPFPSNRISSELSSVWRTGVSVHAKTGR